MPEDTPTETVRSQVSHARPKRLYPPKDPSDRASVGTAVPSFPPPAPSQKHIASIIDQFSQAFDRDAVEEVGCAVCGQLTLATDTVPLSLCTNLDLLASTQDATRKERSHVGESIAPIQGPVLAKGCNSVCSDCTRSLKASRIPLFLLANYLWLGDVPSELQGLTYAEKILVARV